MRYVIEKSGYQFDDYGREVYVSTEVEKEAIHAFHSEREDLWFFEFAGKESAMDYADEFREKGNFTEVLVVPCGVMLHIVKEGNICATE